MLKKRIYSLVLVVALIISTFSMGKYASATESTPNVIEKYPVVKLVPQDLTVGSTESILIDIVFEYKDGKISDLGIFTFESLIEYSDNVIFKDISSNGVSLIDSETPDYNLYDDYFEIIDTSKSGEVAYAFTFKNDNALTEDSDRIVLATLEFQGDDGIAIFDFADDGMVLLDSNGNDIEGINNSGSEVYIDTEAPTLDIASVKFLVDEKETTSVKGGDKLDISFEIDETIDSGYINMGSIETMIPASESNYLVSCEYTVPYDVNDSQIPVTVLLEDLYENISEPVVIGYIDIDNLSPRIFAFIDSEIDGGYVKADNVGVTIETDGYKLIYNINGNEYVTIDDIQNNMVEFNIDISSNDNIEYVIGYEAEDMAGHKSNGSIGFIVDNVSPTKPIITNITEPTYTNSNEIELNGESNGSYLVVKNDGEIVNIHEGFPLVLNLHTGENNFVIYSKDLAGNESEEGTVVASITKDVRRPLISIDSIDGSLIATSNEKLSDCSIEYQLNDKVSNAEILVIDGVEKVYEISGIDLQSSGKHVIKVIGTDLAGNNGYGRLTKVTVDNLDDDLSLTEKAMFCKQSDEGTVSGAIEVKTVVMDPVDGLEFTSEPIEISGENIVEGQSFEEGKGVVVDIDLGIGLSPYTKLYYYDEANDNWIALDGNRHGDSLYNPGGDNAIENPASIDGRELIVDEGHLLAVLHHFSTYGPMSDTSKPEITITSPVIGTQLVNNTVTVTGMVSEDCKSIKINGVPTVVDTDNKFEEAISVSQGDMEIVVNAMDGSNNESSKSVNIFVDSIAPNIGLEGPDTTKDSNIDLTLEVYDSNDVSTKIYRNSENDEKNLVFSTREKGEIAINSLDTKAVKYIAVATDEFGNISSSVYTVGLDTSAPEITINGISDNEKITQASTISISLNESGNWSAKLYEDDILVETYTSSFKINEEGEHSYKIIVTAEDTAKNVNSKEIEFTSNIESQNVSSGGSSSGGSSYIPAEETSDKARFAREGGRAELMNGHVIVDVPQGTFDGDVNISVEIAGDRPYLPLHTENARLMLAGDVYDFDAEGNSFEKPVKITLYYDEDIVEDTSKLGIYMYNENTDNWDFIGGKVDSETNTVSVELEHFSMYAVLEYDKTFADISSHWAKDDIELMASVHIANGMTEDSFMPDGKITRSQFATLLVRAMDLELSESINIFEDVNDEWFADYVATAYGAGLVNGIDDSVFAPESNITREQMAAMIMRAYIYEMNSDYDEIDGSNVMFNDESEISAWAKEAVMAANKLGIINGMNSGKFAPGSDATRAQAIVMIKRLLESMASI